MFEAGTSTAIHAASQPLDETGGRRLGHHEPGQHVEHELPLPCLIGCGGRRRTRNVPICQTAASLIGAGRTRVPLHGVLGTTADGVTAYSNKSDGHWTNEKHHDNNLFMGYKWQCVEFARRWLWETKRLYLPSKNCAYCYAGLSWVYKPVPGPDARDDVKSGPAIAGGADGKAHDSDDQRQRLTTIDYGSVAWEKSPCVYHAQGSRTAPVAGSLIIYPMSRGSPWGHIGVIVDVCLDRRLVYVADQNRFFGPWGELGYSAVFRLDVEDGRHYIRDPESECKGWLVC